MIGPRRLRRFEVQFQRFLQVGESFFLGLALAGDVEFQALGNVPLPLTPNGRSEWSLHDLIVSQARVRTRGPYWTTWISVFWRGG